MTSGTFQEATTAAAQFITLLLQNPDYDRLEWADALQRLANAQYADGDQGAAVENYLLSAETLSEEHDRLHASLIAPMVGAGQARMQAKRYSEAIAILERTLHLQQVNGGLHHISQAETLHDLSIAYYKLGDHRRALSRRQASTSIYYSSFPGDDVRKVPAMLSEARMLRDTGALIDSHTLYRRTVDLIENADGRRSPLLLNAFYELTHLLTRYQINDGYDGAMLARRYLQRAIHIVDKNENIGAIERADAHIQMGDYMATQTLDRAAALRRYQDAWDILTESGETEARDARFGRALLINDVPPYTAPDMLNLLKRVAEREQTNGPKVSARFQVDEEGTPRQIEIVEHDPEGYWARLAAEHVDRFIFRPKIIAREPQVDSDHYWETIYLLDTDDDAE